MLSAVIRYKRTLKFIFIAIALVYVFRHIDGDALQEALGALSLSAIIVAALCIAASQALSGLRMLLYVRPHGVTMGNADGVGLYYLATVINAVAPGGIGGDAFRYLSFNATYGLSGKTGFKLALSERASGLFALLMLAIGMAYYSGFPEIFGVSRPWAALLAALAAGALIICYRAGTRIFCGEDWRQSARAFPYSIAVQLLQLAAYFALLAGLPGADMHYRAEYGLVFFISSVLAMLPVSAGGLGVRELSFYYAGQYVPGMSPAAGTVAATAFFIVHLLPAGVGAIFWIKKRFFDVIRQRNRLDI